jgi:biopolymer transport protein ExbB
MYLLVLLNIVGISLLIWRLFVILEIRKNKESLVASIIDSFKNVGTNRENGNALGILKDHISGHVHKLEFGLNTIKIIASIAPLLGLLGTVIGILSAFRVIAQDGLSNPSLFAGGISMALITTVGGLIVAIPHYIGYNYLVGVLDDLEIELEEKIVPNIFGN